MSTHELFAYLTVSDAAKAIDFYQDVFGGRERFRLTAPDGRIGHVEIELGNTTLMVADAFPEYDIHAPGPEGVTGFAIHLHVDDADDVIRRAADAGATVLMEPADHFYGERSGRIRDPFGHMWTIGHSIEDVPVEEMQRRYDEMG